MPIFLFIIMKPRLFYIFFLCHIISFYSQASNKPVALDTATIDSLNLAGYNIRLTDPEKTLAYAKRALTLSKEIGYTNGTAEAYRILGIAFYYLGKNDKAIANYLIALSKFESSKNMSGQAKVYNNVGNLYKEIDYEKALQYFKRALDIANQLRDPELRAGHYLNIGIIYYRKDDFESSLKYTQTSYNIYRELRNSLGITLSLQNLGVLYNSLGKVEKAERYLLEANRRAKLADLNTVIGSIDLTLVSIYSDKKEFEKADFYLNEGKRFAAIGKDVKLQTDLLKKSYQLENSRHNYKKALSYLQMLYTRDSIELQNTISKKFGLFEEQSKFAAREKESAIKLERAKTNRILFFASLMVTVLAMVLIIILFVNNQKKAKNNRILQVLNEEVSLQKENLDKINHSLEQIIDERTKDLQIKNRKLSEYSSHLSHQIRSPIATMKGLMLLEKDNLIDKKEFIHEIGKCVNDIDDKIININNVLHNLSEPGLIPKSVDKENRS